MPELPEVQTVLNGLLDKLQDRQIIGLECNYKGTVILDTNKVAFPAYVTSFERRGKYILLTLDTDHTIIIHLRMTGKLVFDAQGDLESKHQRACFMLSQQERLLFIDPRTFGKIIVTQTDNLQKWLPKLGVEPLSADFDSMYLQKVLSNRKMPIKTALLDQSVVAGLGNIYVNEILYRAHIHPEKQSNQLQSKQLKDIIKITKLVLLEAISKNGTSISDFRRIDDKTGEFQNFLQVYQKKECPLGHHIEIIRQGGRSTFYCPVCQK